MIPKIITIAGSDPSSGAGIQADIKTAAALGVYCATVITSLTAQNTKKVSAIHNPPIDFLKEQLTSIFNDIEFDAIKIGMLANHQIIEAVAKELQNHQNLPIILDPVMVATSGDRLLETNAINSLKAHLIPKSLIITPNIDEAEILSGIKITTLTKMKESAKIIQKLGAQNVLIKGGHLKKPADKIISILLDNSQNFHFITNKRIKTKPLHGTGCTLASAIACNIAKNKDIMNSTRLANRYVYNSIKSNLEIGKGSRILKHN